MGTLGSYVAGEGVGPVLSETPKLLRVLEYTLIGIDMLGSS